MFYYILEEAAVDEFFIQNLHLNFYSFLGFFQHGSGSSAKAITPLPATLLLPISLKNVWFLIALLLFSSQPYLDYLSLIIKIFTYQTNLRKDLDKSVLSVHI